MIDDNTPLDKRRELVEVEQTKHYLKDVMPRIYSGIAALPLTAAIIIGAVIIASAVKK